MAMYLTKASYELLDSLISMPREIAYIFSELGKMTAQRRYHIKKRLEQLEKEKIVHLSGEIITITDKGRRILEDANLGKVEINKYRWDGVWQIVAWDIPTKLKVNSDILRRILKDLNFTMVNKSFWAYPYRCKEEIGVIVKRLNISDFVMYLQTNSLPNSVGMIKKYNLTVVSRKKNNIN